MKTFGIFTPVFGYWSEKGKQLHGIEDIALRKEVQAMSAEHAMTVARRLGFWAPIVQEKSDV
jgi:hypothetical protein